MCTPGWCQGCDRPILRYDEEEVLCRECREKGVVGTPTPLIDEHGIRREPGTGNPLTIEGAWKDVRQKAKSINTEGAVEIIRLDDEVIASRVIGDHDTYDVVIYRQYPGAGGVTLWECSCKWGDWAFNRTLYNGRMCSHALATLYAAHGYEHRKAKISRKDPDTIIDDPGEHYNPSASTVLREDRNLTLPTHEVFKLLQRTQPHLIRTRVKNTARDWEELESNIRQNGVQHGIFITVDADPEGGHNVRPIINEGTHRTSIAYYTGQPEIPVEAIRYFGASARQIKKPLHEQMWEDHAQCAECNRGTTAKIAGETRKQKLMRMKSLDETMGPSTAEKIWEDDQGNSIWHHNTESDIKREGEMLSNCWRGASSNQHGIAYSLRDKYNIPHVAFHLYPAKHNISFDNYAFHPGGYHPQLGLDSFDKPILMSALGTHNSTIKPEHQQILKQFAKEKIGDNTLVQSRMGAEFYKLNGDLWQPGNNRPEALAWHDELINRKRCDSPDHDRLVKVFGYCGQCKLKSREASTKLAMPRDDSFINELSFIQRNYTHHLAGDNRFRLEAVHPTHGKVGYIEWDDDNLIRDISIKPSYRHKGVATTLYNKVKSNIDIRHSDEITQEGLGWVSSLDEKTGSKLFVDDLRDPPDDSWDVVRTGQEAIERIKNDNEITEISMDHDLGPNSDFDGSSVTQQIIEHKLDNPDWNPPIINIHTDNPIGADRMRGHREDLEKINKMQRGASISYSTDRTSLICIYTGDGEVDVHVEIANNPSAIMHGLMHRSYLPWDSGMAFLFSRLTSDGFWMKNTFIPLSIAFWDSEGYIIDIQDMDPDTDEFNKKVYRPSRPYIGALEVNQGFFDFHNIKIGDKITVIE